MENYLGFLALATGLGLALAAIGSAIGLGWSIRSAVEATARQPEAAGTIRVTLLAGGALIEALTIYSLIIAFVLAGKLPAATEILSKLK